MFAMINRFLVRRALRKAERRKSSTLTFMVAESVSGGYGDVIHVRETTSVKEYLKKIIELHDHRREKFCLICPIFWKGNYYPIIDCDSDDDQTRVEAKLTLDHLNYIRVQTSFDSDNHKHSWFFVDKPFKKGKDSIAFANRFAGQDEKYAEMMKEGGVPYVRFEHKPHAQAPVVAEVCGEVSTRLREFLDTYLKEWANQSEFFDVILSYKWAAKHKLSISPVRDVHSVAPFKDSIGKNLPSIAEISVGDVIHFDIEAEDGREQRRGYIYKCLDLGGVERVYLAREITPPDEDPEKYTLSRFMVWYKHVRAVERTESVELLTSADGELRLLGKIRNACRT